jgi:hypothetical protein
VRGSRKSCCSTRYTRIYSHRSVCDALLVADADEDVADAVQSDAAAMPGVLPD